MTGRSFSFCSVLICNTVLKNCNSSIHLTQLWNECNSILCALLCEGAGRLTKVNQSINHYDTLKKKKKVIKTNPTSFMSFYSIIQKSFKEVWYSAIKTSSFFLWLAILYMSVVSIIWGFNATKQQHCWWWIVLDLTMHRTREVSLH